jgi:ArsR family transcriptional regulator
MTPTTKTASPQVLARRFQALSDEKRIRILQLLAEGERCVCEIQPALGLRQSLLSFHLKTLKDAGLVSDRREGRWVHYSLVPEALEELGDFVHSMSSVSHVVSETPEEVCADLCRP